ncbi:hypothetical protein [Fusobacterium russii]|uniref:hypothetical protein n=1 Tax=Fusobacterium russii TaxID=854 RepID=UPI0003A84A1A|nr:hypothetical protein [Fusobacterium russii]
MKIVSIKEIIKEEIAKNTNLQCSILKIKKNEIFKEISDEITIDYIKNNLLYIGVKNSTVKHYMYTNKNIFLDKINSEFFIEDIKIRVK